MERDNEKQDRDPEQGRRKYEPPKVLEEVTFEGLSLGGSPPLAAC